jgi:peptide/nickel transport system permease protein/oligopeptide transport system permease protein
MSVRYIIRRFILSIPQLIGITIAVFIITRILPGDPARVIAGPLASEEVVEKIRELYGLTKPLYVQYWSYMTDLIQGDLGTSLRSHLPVIHEIMSRLPNTILLIAIGLTAASIIGVPIGIMSAVKRYSIVDYLVTSTALFGISMPVFWTGLMLILLFAVILGWLPAGGFGTPLHFILPSFTLTFFCLANIVRMTRSSMLEMLTQEYVQTARSKGIKEGKVIYKHVLRNAAKPIVTLIGLQFGGLLGGIVLTETVYAWPGIGGLMVLSIFSRDYPVLQGIVLIFALIIIVANLITDLLYVLIDPRIRYR